jgi:Domain of unknown function (DUF4386)
MNADTKAARAVAVLFLVATASYVTATRLIESGLAVPGRSDGMRVGLAALLVLLVLVDAGAVAGIGIAMVSILERWNKHVALGYLALRMIEAVLLVGVFGPLSLVAVIRDPADAAGDLNLALLGVLTGKTSYWAYQMAMVVVASPSGYALARQE